MRDNSPRPSFDTQGKWLLEREGPVFTHGSGIWRWILIAECLAVARKVLSVPDPQLPTWAGPRCALASIRVEKQTGTLGRKGEGLVSQRRLTDWKVLRSERWVNWVNTGS